MKFNRSVSGMRVVLGATLAVIIVTGSLHAQYAEDALRFSTFNTAIGARSAGMGNTSIGLADDFSALFTNPAGLASMRSFEFSAGLSNSGLSDDALFFGNTLNSTSRVTNLNNLGIVYPVPTARGSLSFAFGFARVANYSSSASFSGFNPGSSIVNSLTPDVNLNGMSAADRSSLLDNNIPYQIFLADTSQGRLMPNVNGNVLQQGSVIEGGGLNSWSFGGAIEVAKGLSVGATVDILSGSYSYDRLYTETDSKNFYNAGPPNDFSQLTYESTISSNISGYNLIIGVMYRKQGKYNLGFTVKTPTYFDISEDFADIGHSLFDNGDSYDVNFPGSTKYNVRTPAVLSGGASVQATDWLVLSGDAEYTDWTQMEFTNNNPDLINENRVIRGIYVATTNLRGGAEVTLFNLGLKLRGGYVYNPSPYKNDPSSFDQKYYTAGLGASLDENVFLNASAAFGSFKTFRDNYYLYGITAPSRTSESITSSSLNVTLSFRF